MAHILVIDDETQIRDMMKKILEGAGYEVTVAASGLEGVELYATIKADLVITDIIMPDREGIGTIMEIRGDYPDAKIIAMSGGGRISSEDCLDLANRVGAIRCFQKPVDFDELLDVIRDNVPSSS